MHGLPLPCRSTTEPIRFDTTRCLSLLRPCNSRRCVSVAEPCLVVPSRCTTAPGVASPCLCTMSPTNASPMQCIRRSSLRLCLAGQRESVAVPINDCNAMPLRIRSLLRLRASTPCFADARLSQTSPIRRSDLPTRRALRHCDSARCYTVAVQSTLYHRNARLVSSTLYHRSANLSRSCSAPRCAMPLPSIEKRVYAIANQRRSEPLLSCAWQFRMLVRACQCLSMSACHYA